MGRGPQESEAVRPPCLSLGTHLGPLCLSHLHPDSSICHSPSPQPRPTVCPFLNFYHRHVAILKTRTWGPGLWAGGCRDLLSPTGAGPPTWINHCVMPTSSPRVPSRPPTPAPGVLVFPFYLSHCPNGQHCPQVPGLTTLRQLGPAELCWAPCPHPDFEHPSASIAPAVRPTPLGLGIRGSQCASQPEPLSRFGQW